MPQTKGKMPDWVLQSEIVPMELSSHLLAIQNTSDDVLLRSKIREALKQIKVNVYAIVPTSDDDNNFNANPKAYLDFLSTFRPYRDAFVKVLGNITNKDYFNDVLAEFLEGYKEMHDNDRVSSRHLSQARSALLHEMFIYTIALLWNAEEYTKIRELITRTYSIHGEEVKLTGIVYAGGNVRLIENAKDEVDKIKYNSGIAQYWSENVMSGFSLDQITFADILIYNISILEEPKGSWYWFPMLYIYDPNNSNFPEFALNLKWAHQVRRMAGLFGDGSTERINEKIQKMASLSEDDKYRYNLSFGKAPLILDYVQADEIGTL